MSIMVKIWETDTWKRLIKEFAISAQTAAGNIDKIENPSLDQGLVLQTKQFLTNDAINYTENNGEDFFNLLEGLARKVVPLADDHIDAAKMIYNNFFGEKSTSNRENNIEFLRKIVFCFEEPVNTDTSLNDEEFRTLERLMNAFSDRLKFNPNKQDLAIREDLIVASFRQSGIISGSVHKILKKITKFVGLTSKRETIYDIATGGKKSAKFYYFDSEFEEFLDELFLIDRGFDDEGKEVKYLSDDIPVELLYCFIQAWRANNLEPDILGEYLINGICNLLAYTVLVSLPEGKISVSEEIQQSEVLLNDAVCHPVIIALSKIIAYIIYGDNWLGAIWEKSKKSKYHRTVRYVIVGNIIKIEQGNIFLNNNVMTQYVRNFTVRVTGHS